MKTSSSRSPWSSDSQTEHWDREASHCAATVDFPYPAGALINVTRLDNPSFMRLSRPSRLTQPSSIVGAHSFVLTIVFGTATGLLDIFDVSAVGHRLEFPGCLPRPRSYPIVASVSLPNSPPREHARRRPRCESCRTGQQRSHAPLRVTR